MFRAGLRIGNAETPAMLQRRNRLARGLDLGGVDLRQEDAGLNASFGEHRTPGVDDQGVAKGLALVLMHASLRCGEHKAAGLDGAGAQQRVPVRCTGVSREGGGHGEERRTAFGERAIQRRKAHVVTDRQTNPAPGQVGDDGGFARLIVGGFAIALAAGQVDVEHMDLVVACDHEAVRPDQERTVDGLLGRSAQRQ